MRTALRGAAIVGLLVVAQAAGRPGIPRLAQDRPQRIISLVPAATEILFAIGAGSQVVAVSSFDTYPPEARALPRVGALIDPDLERILALKADLVIGYATQTDVLAQISRAHIPIFEYEHAGLDQVGVTITRLGERTGHPVEAARVLRHLETQLQDIRRRVEGRRRPRTLLVFSRDADTLRGIYASGGIGFLHDMLTAAGGQNVFADAPRESVQVSTELVLARRPDVILEIRGVEMAEEDRRKSLAVWNALGAVPAVRAGRVIMIADQRTVVPGPRVGEGTELIARVLHPEAFE